MIIGVCIIGFGVYSYFSNDFTAAGLKNDFAVRILPFYIGFSGVLILGIECGYSAQARAAIRLPAL